MLLLRAVIGMGELNPASSDPEPLEDIKLEYFPSSLPGSRMGRWDHCMRLQTLSTSVPVMVSTIPNPWVARILPFGVPGHQCQVQVRGQHPGRLS